MKHNLAVLDAFAKTVKVTDDTDLRDAKLIWYSLIATHQISQYSLEHGFRIHDFRPTWS